jgi:hypothetical protein
MTVICWDGKTLAADKNLLSHTTKFSGTKIKKVNDLLVGYSGPASIAEQFFLWAEKRLRRRPMPQEPLRD